MIETLDIASALARAARRLDGAGLPGSRLDARLLLCHATGLALERIVGYPERPLTRGECERFEALLIRRIAREPLSQIVGRREFWSLPFKVTGDTLTPRPETETLVEAALVLMPERNAPCRILDLGTGTGCLLLALLSELPASEGVGVELSEPAARTARENARRLGLASRARFVVGDWDACIEGRFDLVVSNPPYIRDDSIAGLDPEVALHEPRIALAGGPDGLACYRALGPVLARRVAPGGRAILEVGAGQADVVEAIFARVGLLPAARRADLAGIERCLIMAPGS
jgi:release factor glutamine methyltransferase